MSSDSESQTETLPGALVARLGADDLPGRRPVSMVVTIEPSASPRRADSACEIECGKDHLQFRVSTPIVVRGENVLARVDVLCAAGMFRGRIEFTCSAICF